MQIEWTWTWNTCSGLGRPFPICLVICIYASDKSNLSINSLVFFLAWTSIVTQFEYAICVMHHWPLASLQLARTYLRLGFFFFLFACVRFLLCNNANQSATNKAIIYLETHKKPKIIRLVMTTFVPWRSIHHVYDLFYIFSFSIHLSFSTVRRQI